MFSFPHLLDALSTLFLLCPPFLFCIFPFSYHQLTLLPHSFPTFYTPSFTCSAFYNVIATGITCAYSQVVAIRQWMTQYLHVDNMFATRRQQQLPRISSLHQKAIKGIAVLHTLTRVHYSTYFHSRLTSYVMPTF